MSPNLALTIAGSDCSAGAGLQADLKTFHHFGLHGLTAATCVVAETPNEVRSIFPVPVEILRDQVEILLESYPVGAIKTGMLFSADHILAVSRILARHPSIPLVVDPVMIASTGDPLLEPDAVAAYESELLPLATVITPNLDEAKALDRHSLDTEAAMEAAAGRLADRFGTAVLIKGGHLQQIECADLLHQDTGAEWLRSPRIETSAGHGTGCTLSAAIAAGLARGESLLEATRQAKEFLNQTLRHALKWGDVAMLNQGLSSVSPS
jgi:hydroxymethylpyrimidine/phosphomethylpyrimidine kinase